MTDQTRRWLLPTTVALLDVEQDPLVTVTV